MNDIDLRFGPSQKKTVELAYLIPQFISFGSNADEEWSDAVNAYSDLLPDSVAVVTAENRLWHHMWQRKSVVDLITVLLVLEYCGLFPNLHCAWLQLLATILVTTAELSRVLVIEA